MSITDSRAAFEAHCGKVDPTGFVKDLLSRSHITSFSALAFAIGTPQSPPTDDQFRQFGSRLNGDTDLTIGMNSALRRLHFEASTMVVAELKSMATEPSGETVRKLPVAEKIARLQDQETRLRGLRIRGELQPSYALVDLISNIKETNNVVWIAPSKCGKRDLEIQNSQKQKSSVLSLEQQTLKVTSNDIPTAADTSSDIQLQWALQRRGLAFDQCRLINWDAHELWVQQVMSQITKDSPPGYHRIAASQVIRADRELFTLMAQELQTSVQVLPDGSLPMETKLKELRTDPRVTMHMLPLPKTAPRDTDISDKKSAGSGHQEGDPPGPPVKPKKKARASPKAKALCPDELKGYQQRDAQNNTICWAFNLKGGCKESTKSGRCKKGMHICIKCHKSNHSLTNCRAKDN